MLPHICPSEAYVEIYTAAEPADDKDPVDVDLTEMSPTMGM